MSPPLLQISDVSKTYHLPRTKAFSPRRTLTAVDHVSLEIEEGEVLAVVGESGSGKSTLASMVGGLLRPTDGRILYRGVEVACGDRAGQELARHEIQMVFQDPAGSLDPRMKVGDSVAEPLKAFSFSGDRRRRVEECLRDVGLGASYADRYPHSLSGGQRQRVAIARALAPRPTLLIADEPVTSLDVSVQAQVINLLSKLQREHGLAMLFIAHDLSVVFNVADGVAVMYQGKIVEHGDTQSVFSSPQHPYTRLLMRSIIDLAAKRLPTVTPRTGQESPPQSQDACVFAPRCPHVFERCRQAVPPLVSAEGASSAGHVAACLLLEQPVRR